MRGREHIQFAQGGGDDIGREPPGLASAAPMVKVFGCPFAKRYDQPSPPKTLYHIHAYRASMYFVVLLFKNEQKPLKVQVAKPKMYKKSTAFMEILVYIDPHLQVRSAE